MASLRPLMLASLMAVLAAGPAMANEIGLSGRSGGRGVADKVKAKEPKALPPAAATLPATPFRPATGQMSTGAAASNPGNPMAYPSATMTPPASGSASPAAPRSSQTVNGPNGMRIVGSDTMPPSPPASQRPATMMAPMGTPAVASPAVNRPPVSAMVPSTGMNRSMGGNMEPAEAVQQIGFDPKARRDASGKIIADEPVAGTVATPSLRSDRSLGGDMSRLRQKQVERAGKNAVPPEDRSMDDDELAAKLKDALEKRDAGDKKLVKPGTTISSGRNRNF